MPLLLAGLCLGKSFWLLVFFLTPVWYPDMKSILSDLNRYSLNFVSLIQKLDITFSFAIMYYKEMPQPWKPSGKLVVHLLPLLEVFSLTPVHAIPKTYKMVPVISLALCSALKSWEIGYWPTLPSPHSDGFHWEHGMKCKHKGYIHFVFVFLTCATSCPQIDINTSNSITFVGRNRLHNFWNN